MGQVTQTARYLTTDWAARIRSRVSEGLRFSSLLRVQIGPRDHSAFHKMSIRFYIWVNAVERRSSHPTSSWYRSNVGICRFLHSHLSRAFMACNGDTITFTTKKTLLNIPLLSKNSVT